MGTLSVRTTVTLIGVQSRPYSERMQALIDAARAAAEMAGVIHINPVSLAQKMTWVIVGSALLYFIYLFAAGGLTREEMKRGRLAGIEMLSYTLGPLGGEARAGLVADATIERNTMAEAAGIRLPSTPPLLHYALRQDMLAWWPTGP